ncbi:hypothetical protein N7463_003376 [Penicillium fimorum]|uniref:Uncharacterized protein n=1 Tax=Penicillium fimorum TaxID=1882269 RepID=A0A9W9Y2F1_9EURO|nr:hypothetical protein N7463_003376 [Penicillium fimorum]
MVDDIDSGDHLPDTTQILPSSSSSSSSNPINNSSQDRITDLSKHQGTNLPDVITEKIQNVKVLETNTKNSRSWGLLVKFALAPLRLDCLIDSSLPHPTKDHQNSNYGSTGHEPIPEHADTMYDRIMIMVRGSGKVEEAHSVTRRLDKMKRSDYASAKEYIEEYQKHYQVLARFSIAPHPFHALPNILWDLEREVPKVHFIIEQISNVEPRRITLEQMHQYCKGLQLAADTGDPTNSAQSACRGGRGSNRGSRVGHGNLLSPRSSSIGTVAK